MNRIKSSLIEMLFKKAYEAGIEDSEIFYQGDENFSVKIYKGDIDKFSLSEDGGLSLRGKYNGKMGYAYTEKLSEAAIDDLIMNIIENAKLIDSDDEEEFFEGGSQYQTLDKYNKELAFVAQQDKVQLVKDLEQEILKLDERVKMVNTCMYGDGDSILEIKNTKGLELNHRNNMAYIYASAVFKDGELSKTAGDFQVSADFKALDYKSLARKIVDDGIGMLGAKPVKTGKYKIVLQQEAMADLLEGYMSNFSAENVQKDLSALKGKLGEQIAVEQFNLIDDPFLPQGMASRAFDGEGVPTRKKNLIEDGKLATFLHNLKTAKKEGIESTGNAYKSSYKGVIGISATNLYIEPQEHAFEEMLEAVGQGLLIKELSGLHSGINALSGQFSLLAEGFVIRDGKIAEPVNQITVAGNFFDLLKNIQMIGNDLKFMLPSGGTHMGAPSVYIGELVVAGE